MQVQNPNSRVNNREQHKAVATGGREKRVAVPGHTEQENRTRRAEGPAISLFTILNLKWRNF